MVREDAVREPDGYSARRTRAGRLLGAPVVGPRWEIPCRTVTFLSCNHYQNALVNHVPRETFRLLCRYFSLKLSGKVIAEYI